MLPGMYNRFLITITLIGIGYAVLSILMLSYKNDLLCGQEICFNISKNCSYIPENSKLHQNITPNDWILQTSVFYIVLCFILCFLCIFEKYCAHKIDICNNLNSDDEASDTTRMCFRIGFFIYILIFSIRIVVSIIGFTVFFYGCGQFGNDILFGLIMAVICIPFLELGNLFLVLYMLCIKISKTNTNEPV